MFLSWNAKRSRASFKILYDLNKRRVLALGESNDSFGVVTRRQAREIIK